MLLFKKIIVIAAAVYMLSSCSINAQQVIINVPNADILRKGQYFGRFPLRFRPFDGNKYYILNNDLLVGVGKNTEVAAAITNMNYASSHVEPFFRTGFQTVVFLNESQSNRFTFGTRLETNLTRAETPFNLNYAHFSKRFKFDNARITAGIYTANEHDFLPNKTGALLGLEGTIIKDKLLYSVDWISRNEAYGYLGIGIKYFPNKSTILIPGVNIPNGNNAHFGFIFVFAKYFN